MNEAQQNFHTCLNLFRGAYKVIEEDWQKSAQEIGITLAEQHILWILHIEGRCTMSRVAEVGLWDLSTVMQIMKRLKNKELVKTEKKANDLRVSYVTLTNQGEKLREESAGKTHRFNDFIQEYANKGESEQKFLADLMTFLKEANSVFHGSHFVKWLEQQETSRIK
ncbi:MarR family winged helix-turn-helix transcriptional regulator [Thalassorhabdus alkalitolerans]|uniref:MarR family winged helix-turn-helix transcriptional regulator n=1 Tax=Thalassorhabdus alkalitolerans TaxID=2282697 RepID=A0ABW0YSH5_9BACI